MNCDDLREDLEAYALDALEPAQARRVAAHLSACKDCDQVVRAYKTTVEHLALSVPVYRAPVRLKQRILGGAGATARGVRPRTFIRQHWWAASAASVLVFLAIGALAWAVMLSAEVNRLRNDNEDLAELTQLDAQQRTALLRLQGDLMSARSEQRRLSSTLQEQATLIVLALDPELIPTELVGTTLANGSRCNYVWSSQQHLGALTCKDLPTTSGALNYELWANKGDKTVPLGTFLPRLDGSAQLLVSFPEDTPGPVSKLWVTLEQVGTARRAPSNDVVLQPTPAEQAAR